MSLLLIRSGDENANAVIAVHYRRIKKEKAATRAHTHTHTGVARGTRGVGRPRREGARMVGSRLRVIPHHSRNAS